MSFGQPDESRLSPLIRDNLESFTADSLLTRHLGRRNGATSTSTVKRLVASSEDLRSSYDLSWLRSPVPPPKGRGRPIVIADLFAGCGGLSLGVAEACRALNHRVEHAVAFEMDADRGKCLRAEFPVGVAAPGTDRRACGRRAVCQKVDARASNLLTAFGFGPGYRWTTMSRAFRSQQSHSPE